MTDADSESCKRCGIDMLGLVSYTDPDDTRTDEDGGLTGPRIYCLDCWRDIGYGDVRRPEGVLS